MIEDQQKNSISIVRKQSTIRADIITNHQFALMLIKLLFFFFLTCYIFQVFPSAIQVTTYTPEKWERVDILEIHQISPLNRFIKVYTAPANQNKPMDAVMGVEVYSLRDNQEKDKKLDVQVTDLDNFVDISQNQLRFYFGDVHILDQVAYRVKISKPIKVQRLLQQQPTNSTLISTNSTQQNKNKNKDNSSDTNTNETQIKQQKQKQQQRKRKQQQQKAKAEQQRKKKQMQQQQQRKNKQQQQQRKKKQQQQRKIKQAEQLKQQQRKRQEQQAKLREQQRIKKQEERKAEQQRQRIYDYTNIRVQVHQMNSFATIVELIIRYISILVIIYIATDNADAPRSIAVICMITSNPVLFLQISYPNIVSDIIDCLCRSGPMLYFPLWLYYIHTSIDVSITQKSKYQVYLGIKIGLGILLYLINTLLLLHFHVFGLQTLVAIVLSFLIGKHLWEIFLNLQQQHHRDKVLMVVSFVYLGSLFTFKIIAGSWRDLMFYIIHQMYGLYVIYLMASPKSQQKKIQKKPSYPQTQIQTLNPPQQQFKQRNQN